MKEALFYTTKDDYIVKCNLCPQECQIQPGNTGFCGVRKNVNGKLYSLVYEQVSSEAVDPIEKKPLYNFYPGSYAFSVGTLGCNMRCKHCQNWQIAHTNFESAQRFLTTTSPKQLIKSAIASRSRGVAFTYNEPTIWFEYTFDCSKLAKEQGLYTVYVTSGWINQEPLKMIAPFIDAFSLDIKGFSDEFYKKLSNKNTFKPILDTAIYTKKNGIHLEIVTNIIPTYNDDFEQLDGLSKWIVSELGDDTPFHLTAFHPAHKLMNVNETSLTTLESAYKIATSNGLKYVYLGNVLSDYGSTTYCPNCKTPLIKRRGFGIIENLVQNGKCPKCEYKLPSYVS